jgi:hypothetical protein
VKLIQEKLKSKAKKYMNTKIIIYFSMNQYNIEYLDPYVVINKSVKINIQDQPDGAFIPIKINGGSYKIIKNKDGTVRANRNFKAKAFHSVNNFIIKN